MPSATSAPRRVWDSLIDLCTWGAVAAVGAGCAWAFGILVGVVLLNQDISKSDDTSIVFLVELRVATLGLLVGSVAAAAMLRPAVIAVAYWGPVLAVAAVLGNIMSRVTIQELHGVLPSQLSASLGFAVGGLFTGICGYVWFRLTTPPAVAETEDEDAEHPPSEGTSDVPIPRLRTDVRVGVRTVLIAVAGITSVAGAEQLAKTNLTLGVLAGLFGLSVSISLWDQEQRLRFIERHHHRR